VCSARRVMSGAGEMGGEYRVICELKLDVQKNSDRDPSLVSLGYSAKRSVLAREVEGSERSGNQPNFS
jgi:hypothetical protein